MSDDPIPRLRFEPWAAHDELADYISRQLGFGPLHSLPAGLREDDRAEAGGLGPDGQDPWEPP